MKKWILTIGLTLVIGLLSACSIPIGSGELIVSTDGIDFIKGDGEEDIEGETDVFAPEFDEDGEVTEDEDPFIDESAFGDDDGAIPEDVNVEDLDPGRQSNCNRKGHDKVLSEIGHEFYIPECAELASQQFSNNSVNANFTIPNANYETVAEDYNNFFSGKNIEIDERIDFDSEYVYTHFKLDENSSSLSYIEITQSDDGSVRLKVVIYK